MSDAAPDADADGGVNTESDADAGPQAGAEVGAREPAIGRSVGSALTLAAGAVFWGWILLRWVNDWLGGVLVPKGEPFVDPAAIGSVADGVPAVGPAFDALGFAAQYLPRLADGLWLTVVLTVVSVVVGLLLAVPLSVARVYGRITRYASFFYTELIRGTPLLAQLFVLYYGLNLSRYVPSALEGTFPTPAVWVAILGFTLNGAAYQAEYIRGAIQSVDAGQMTAGRAVGLSKLQTIRYVVLPQTLRYAIPSWSNELVYLIKYSSLAAFITVPELFHIGDSIVSQNFRYLAVFSLVAALYLGLVVTASKLMSAFERRVAIPGLGHAADERG